MKSGPYHVEFLTWNTHSDVGQGLGSALDAKNYGGNFGHASVEISFPYGKRTEQWVEKYCRNIELYEPQDEQAREEGEVYKIDVPVFYTTTDGQRIFDPKTYQSKNPDAEIVTHVYLSWVPGKYAAQRDERDPFKMQWRGGFELYTDEQDRNMEYVGHGVDFKRGFDGYRELELDKRGGVEGSKKYITRGIDTMIHMLTEDEVRYFSLTPSEMEQLKRLESIYSEIEVKDIQAVISNFENELKGKSLEEKGQNLGVWIEKFPIISHVMNLSFSEYRTINPEPDEDEDLKYYMGMVSNFIEKDLDPILKTLKENADIYLIVQEQRMIQKYLQSVSSIESNALQFEKFIDDYDRSIVDMKAYFATHSENSEQRSQYPIFFEFYDKTEMDYEDYLNSDNGFKKDLANYNGLRAKVVDRFSRQQQGLSTDSTVILPISRIKGLTKGHKDGLNVEKMLKAIPEFVANGKGYSLEHKNCSDFANHFGYAGAPAHLREQFNRAAIGWFATPQVVNNSALNYGNIIYASGYQPGTYRDSKATKFYLKREKEVAKISKKYNELKEKISFEDARINYFLNILKDERKLAFEEYENSELFSTLLEGILEEGKRDFNTFRSQEREEIVKQIYQYCNEKIKKNIKEDCDKIYPMIKEESGYYKELVDKKPAILESNAIKTKMKSLYGAVYGNKPFLGKTKKLNADFASKGELYLRACHTIMYENSLGTWNLADPNYVSMEHERKEVSKLKTKLFVGMFGLLRMRMAANIFFKDSMNVDDPWFELKWASYHSRGIIDNYIGMQNSKLRTAANIARGVYIGYSSIRQALLIAPRRYVQAAVSKLKSQFRSQKSIEEAYKAEKGVDILHELKSGRTTIEKLVTERMKSEYISKMGPLARTFTSSGAITRSIQEAYNQKNELFVKADKEIRSQLPNDIEKTILKSNQNRDRMREQEESIIERSMSVDASNLEKGLESFEKHLDNNLFPYFSEKVSNRILKKSQLLDKYVASLDAKVERQLGDDLIHDLVQFEKMSMIYCGIESNDRWGSMFVYHPSSHGKIIPDEILNEKTPSKIQDFLIERIKEMRNKDIEVDILRALTPEKIEKLNLNQLNAIVQYLAKPSYVDRVNQSLKLIVSKSLEDEKYFKVSQYVPFKDHEVDFYSFLNEAGFDHDVLNKINKNNSLENLFIKLSHDVLSHRSSENLVKFTKKNIDPTTLSKKQTDEVNYQLANEIKRASEWLGRGRWPDFEIAPRSYLEHDIRLQPEQSGHWGREGYIVKQNGLTFERPNRSPVKVSLMQPETITLKNRIKDPKEIFMVFHEDSFVYEKDGPSEIRKALNFSNASSMVGNRHKDLNASPKRDERSINGQLLVKLREQLIQIGSEINQNDPVPRVRLSIGGEGLGGLDAQLFLAAVAADLKDEKKGILRKYKNLSKLDLEINLVTIDSAKTTASIAESTAKNLAEIQKKFPNIKFNGIDVQHGELQEKLGQKHVMADVSSDVALLQLQSRSKEGGLIHSLSNDSPRPDRKKILSSKLQNGLGAFIYATAPFRVLNNIASLGRTMVNVFKPLKSKQSPEAQSQSPTESHNIQTNKPLEGVHLLNQKLMRLSSETSDDLRLQKRAKAPIENLVFEGGGVKGLVYAGALRKMSESGLYRDVKRVAGSSAGGIVSTLLAMGYPPSDIEEQMLSINFKEMMDSTGQEKAFTSIGGKLYDLYSLFKNKGIYKGEKFLEVLSNKIESGLEQRLIAHFEQLYLEASVPREDNQSLHQYNLRLMLVRDRESDLMKQYVDQKILETKRALGIVNFSEITFKQHHDLKETFPTLGLKDLYLTGTLMETGTLTVFSYETHPNMEVRDATRATMSFPGAFMPYEINGKVYADGGIANNYPMSIFDQDKYLPKGHYFNDAGANPGSLGFLVDSQSEINERWGVNDRSVFPKLTLPTFLKQLIGGLHNRADELHRRYHVNSIQIFDEKVPTMDLEITDDKKAKLISSGYQAMDFYASNYGAIDVVPDSKRFTSREEKYIQSSLADIKTYLMEIEGHLEALETLKIEYTKELELHRDRLKMAEDSKDDSGIKSLQDSIEVIEIALGDPDNPNSKGVIDQCVERLEAERLQAQNELTRRSSRSSDPKKPEAVVFSDGRSKPDSIEFKSTVMVMENSEPHFNAAKAALADTEFECTFTKPKIMFTIPLENCRSTATIEKKEGGQLRYAVDFLPKNDQQMQKALMDCYDVMFQSILKTEKDRTVTLNLDGQGQELQILETVLNELNSKHQSQLSEKNIVITIEPPRAAAALSQA
ncbi:MAG: patatin-like phospholipase family protein [Gammaproteobacteria bacterium]